MHGQQNNILDIFFNVIFLSRPTVVSTQPYVPWVVGGEVNHPLPSTAEVKNEGSYASTLVCPHITLRLSVFTCTKLTGLDL
jgi:hypothetical protein